MIFETVYEYEVNIDKIISMVKNEGMCVSAAVDAYLDSDDDFDTMGIDTVETIYCEVEKRLEEEQKNKGLFQINFDNGFNDDFNEGMQYLLEQLPEVEIVKEKPEEKKLLVRTLSNEAYCLLCLLYEVDCLDLKEIRDIEGD